MYEIIHHRYTRTNALTPIRVSTADLAFADPPYNYGFDYADDPTGDKVDPDEFKAWIGDVIDDVATVTKPGGLLFWLCPAEQGAWTQRSLERWGTLLQGKPIIWHERFSQYQARRLTSDYRLLFPLIVGADKPNTFNPDAIREESERQRMGDKRADPRGRVPGHVWRVRRLQGTAKDRVAWHPAQLPPEPLDRIVRGWTNPGDTVLDAFAGSGSMGVAALKAGRRFIGVDGSPTYCARLEERLGDVMDELEGTPMTTNLAAKGASDE